MVCYVVSPWQKTPNFVWTHLRPFHTGFCLTFAFTWCTSNTNWIHVGCVHTARFYNWIVTELLLACHTHQAPETIFTLALSSQHSRCIETHTKANYMPYLVTGSRRRGTWILTKYMRPLCKRYCFQQHLVSCISMTGHCSWYLGRRIQHVWWPRHESFNNAAN